MKRIKLWIITLAIAASTAGSLIVVSAPAVTYAADATTKSCGDDGSFLGLPYWYRNVVDPTTCEIKSPEQGDLSKFIWQIVLNVIDILLRLVGYIAVAFLIYGGFLFITSQQSPDGVAKARKTLTNAIIGLVASMASVAIINLLMGTLLQ